MKGRIPNLPKSLADPVSPCSLILCIFQREQLEVQAHLWRCFGEQRESTRVKGPRSRAGELFLFLKLNGCLRV